MAEVASPSDGARFEGFVTVQQAAPRGMITLRGDLGSAQVAAPVAAALRAAVGLGVPGQRQILAHGACAVAWMSPDELLVMVPRAQVPDTVAALVRALDGAFATVADVSDARSVFTVQGALVDEALMKLCPVDFASLGAGELRRTRAAQVAAALWRSGEAEVTLVCFRSVADYVFALLCNAAAPGGALGLR